MAVPVTNAWTSYGVGWPITINSNGTASAIGNKEQFLGEIAIIDPTDTPTFNLLPKEGWTAPYQEWPIDSLAGTATAASPEAWEFEAEAVSGRTRYTNVTQAFHKGVLVSRRQQQMSQRGVTQGVGDEFRYQIGKKLMELNRNINARILANVDVASATGTTAAGSRTAALRAYPIIATNVSGAWATASYHNLRRKMDEAGAMPDTLLVSSAHKADISNSLVGFGSSQYNSSVRINRMMDDRSVGGTVEVIEDDYGQVGIYRDRWLPLQGSAVVDSLNTSAKLRSIGSTALGAYFLFDRKHIRVGVFQPPTMKALPPNGDYERGFVMAEIATKVMHPSSVGIGANITNTEV